MQDTHIYIDKDKNISIPIKEVSQGVVSIGKHKENFMFSFLEQLSKTKDNHLFILPDSLNLKEELIQFNQAIYNSSLNIHYLSPDNLDLSFSFNPLYKLSNQEIIELLIKIDTDLEHEENSKQLLSLILRTLELLHILSNDYINIRENITFKDLNYFVSKEGRNKLKNNLIDINILKLDIIDLNELERLKEEKKSILLFFEDIENHSYTILEDLLLFISTGKFEQIFSSVTTNPFISIFEEDFHKNIFFIQSDLKDKKISLYFYNILFLSLSFLYDTYFDRELTNLNIYINDAEKIVNSSMETLLSKTNSFKLNSLLFFSHEILDKHLNNILEDNINLKIYTKHTVSNKTLLSTLIQEEINLLGENDFLLTDYTGTIQKGIIPPLFSTDFFIDEDDWFNYDLNNLYIKFKNIVSEEKYHKIIKKALSEIIYFSFKKNSSLTSVEEKKLNGVEEYLKLINLKDHILDLFEVSLYEFEQMSEIELEENKLLLIASIFKDFGKSSQLKKSLEISLHSQESHLLVTQKYIEELFSKIYFPEYKSELLEIIKNLNSPLLEDFENKSRKFELKVITETNNFVRKKFSFLLNNFEKEFLKNKEEELKQLNSNFIKLVFMDNKIIVEKDKSISEIIYIKNISNISFSVEKTKYKNNKNFVDIYMNNGIKISLDNIKEEDLNKF